MCAVVLMGTPAGAGKPGTGGGGGGSTKPVKVGTPNGNFSCRASLARIVGEGLLNGVLVEANVANAKQNPCETDFAGILATLNLEQNLFHKKLLTSTLLDLKLKVLYGGTDLLKDYKTSPALPRKAVAEAGVAILRLELLRNVIEVAVLTSNAKARCSSTNNPYLLGDSQVVGVRLNGTELELLPGHGHINIELEVDLGLLIELQTVFGIATATLNALLAEAITLHFNHQSIANLPDGKELTQRALWLDTGIVGDVIVAESIADYHGNPCTTTTGPPPPPPPPHPANDWMTGGGRINDSGAGKVTHGFRLECTPSAGQNNLQVNWADGGFHLLSATTATCNNGPGGVNNSGSPTAGFDTLTGTGTGRCRGGGTATASYQLVDNGEPGSSDTWSITITGACNLTASGTLERGNHQAHGRF